MKRIGRTMFAVFATALFSASALAGAPEGSWYVAPQVNALWLDDDRAADDDAGATLAFGKVLSEKWDAQVSFFGSEHDRAAGAELELQGFALGVNRVFYRDSRVSPFLSLGLGKVNSLLKPGLDESHLSALYGVGVLVDLGQPRQDGTLFQLRGDLGARRGLASDEVFGEAVDYVAGLGFQFSWGGTPARRVVDSDGDGVNDDADQCPGTPAGTAVDANGCPLPQDDDRDGVVNEADKCPGTPPGTRVDASGCELDSDGDGVGDSRDQCPNTPAGAKVDDKGCELDGDADGVVDSQDKCPDTPRGDRVDATGCSFKDEIKLPGVVFETNSADLKPESIPVLEGAVATLKRYPDLRIQVAGHTDSRGSDAYNLDLSSRRAATVLKFLQDGGVANNLVSRGYGERQPVASNTTEDGRQQNRRVVLRVLN
jgi:OOP family OmpA-OmpF porin